MKKILLAAILIASCFPLFSQMNNVKLGLGSAVQLDLNLKYERAFNDHHAIQVAVMWDSPLSLSGSIISNQIEWIDSWLFEEPVFIDVAGRVSGFAIVPEYRYYFGSKGPLQGFYAGAFLKLRNRNFVFNDSFGTDIPVEAKINLRNMGLGVGCGYQWIINDAISIDWHIFGIGAAAWSIQASVKPDDPADFDEIKQEILDGIDEWQFGGGQELDPNAVADFEAAKDEFKTIVENQQVNSFTAPRIRSIIPLPDLRFGLSVGYAF